MKIYDLDQGDWFQVAGDRDSPKIRFHHLDGMYSLCYTESGEIIHLVGFTPVQRAEEPK